MALKVKELLAGNYFLAHSVFSKTEVQHQKGKRSLARHNSCPGRVKCLERSGIYFAATFAGPIAALIFNIYTFSDSPQLWNYKVSYCALDTTLLVFTSPFLFLALCIKNLVGCILTPKLCYKEIYVF